MVRAVSSRMYTLQAEPLVVFLIDEASIAREETSLLARSLLDLKHWSSLRSLLRTYERSTCSKSRGKEALPESRQAFEVAAAQTSGLVNLVFSRQIGFIESEHLFIVKPIDGRKRARCSKRTAIRPWVRNYIPARCWACSTKILVDSWRVFLEYAEIDQAKERLCWQRALCVSLNYDNFTLF